MDTHLPAPRHAPPASPVSETATERSVDHSSRHDCAVGTSIEVRSRFREAWSRGFEVAEATQDGYWVRRLSDRYVLPVEFVGSDVRRVS